MNLFRSSIITMSRHTKKIVFFTLGMFVCGFLSFAPAAATLQTLQTGMEAPDFSLNSLTGSTKTFSEIKGQKLTILVFWSTWSQKSGPALTRLQQLYDKYRDQGLSVIGVNVDDPTMSTETMTEIRKMLDKMKISFPIFIDNGLVAFHDYGVIAIPTTVILDGNRVIKEELSGFPLVGSELMVDTVINTMEGRKEMAATTAKKYKPDKTAVRFYNMGKAAQRSRRTAETSEMWFKKAIETDAGFVLPHLGLGKIYLQVDPAKAKAEYKEALAKDPDNPIALCELGLILVNEGKTNEGESLFDTALKEEESYVPCYYYSGYSRGISGNLDEAVKLFAEAEKMNPFDYNNFIYQGRTFEGLKDQQRAVEAYKKALKLILHVD
jgi:peroxiredoxin/Tfp pilus assembly protein PilF